MTTWTQVREHVIERVPAEELEGGLVMTLPDGRRRAVVELRSVEAFGEPWLEVTTAVARVGDVDLVALLGACSTLAVGGVARVEDVIVLRHAMSLAGIVTPEEVLRVAGLLAADARRLRAAAKRPTSPMPSVFAHYA